MNPSSVFRRRFEPFRLRPGKVLLVAILLLVVAGNAVAAVPSAVTPVDGRGAEARGPRLIVENVGQFAPEARFTLAHGKQRIWLTDDAIWLVSSAPSSDAKQNAPRAASAAQTATAWRFTFPGANPAAQPQPFGRSNAHVSYFIGNDPARWRSDAPVWSGVRYRDLYPGVDLIVGDNAAGLVPWRLEARPGANLAAVALKVEGSEVTAAAGQLRLEGHGQTVDLLAPTWAIAGQRDLLASSVSVQPGAITLAPAAALSVDLLVPAATPDAGDLVYSRLTGGSALDAGYGIAVDYAGNAYVTGEVASSNFPVVAGSYDTTYGGSTDAFVAKYNSGATSLVYATYLGGSSLDLGFGVAVNGSLAYVVGETSSTNFPGTSGSSGESDIFVVSLNATGSAMRYTTLIGGADYDMAGGIALWGPDAYIVGSTDSSNLSGSGCAGIASRDLVVARLGATGMPVYTRCFGGSDLDAGYGIDVANEVAYVTGESWSPDIVPPAPLTGENDVLVATFTDNGSLQDVALIGGGQGDQGNGIAADVDANGNGYIYVVGTTSSDSFPLAVGSGPDPDETDAVVLRVGLEMFAHDFAAYLGGSSDDDGRAIAVDTVGGLYVTGSTLSTDFPTTAGAYDTTQNQRTDAFVARMHLNSAATNRVTYATYLGGKGDDTGYGAATDTGGHAFVAGSSGGQGFPTTVGPSPAGDSDSFAAKLKVSQPPAAPVVAIAASGSDAKLTWPTVSGAVKYQVFRGPAPYFKPGDWGSALLLPEPVTGEYLDVDALAQLDGYFYEVKSVSAAPEHASASSNGVGKFVFQLQRGN